MNIHICKHVHIHDIIHVSLYVCTYIYIFIYLFILVLWCFTIAQIKTSVLSGLTGRFSLGNHVPLRRLWRLKNRRPSRTVLSKAQSWLKGVNYLSQGRDGSFDGLSHHASRPQGGWWMEASGWDEEQKQAKQESTGGRSGQWPWEHQVQIHWWIQMRWGWRKRCNEQGNLVRTTHY